MFKTFDPRKHGAGVMLYELRWDADTNSIRVVAATATYSEAKMTPWYYIVNGEAGDDLPQPMPTTPTLRA